MNYVKKENTSCQSKSLNLEQALVPTIVKLSVPKVLKTLFTKCLSQLKKQTKHLFGLTYYMIATTLTTKDTPK